MKNKSRGCGSAGQPARDQTSLPELSVPCQNVTDEERAPGSHPYQDHNETEEACLIVLQGTSTCVYLRHWSRLLPLGVASLDWKVVETDWGE